VLRNYSISGLSRRLRKQLWHHGYVIALFEIVLRFLGDLVVLAALVTRAHVIAWREDLVQRGLGGMTVRHRLAALSSLFEYLCEKNAVTHNPVRGVKRPRAESYCGKPPALSEEHARHLLDAPDPISLKDKRDRAILATLLYHGAVVLCVQWCALVQIAQT